MRVGETRVTLDTVVYAFQEGLTAEEILHQYPTLALGDIYAVIGHYLHHRHEIDDYLAQREQAADDLRREIEDPADRAEFRRRLLARQRNG
jgi:uncharacterized protein (DUF433 family)